MSNALSDPAVPSVVFERQQSVPGAIVVGGDYQGLGILRSLGRHGVPICVVDDEFSISRFSKYCTHFVKAPHLREEQVIVDSLLDIACRLGLSGWVIYPTREELVAAFSHHREVLSRVFRVPTPPWESVKWAWDKRNTYRLAAELGIPTPAIFYLENADDLGRLEGLQPPFVVKPAIKEHFVYATRAKAWRADSIDELRVLVKKAFALVGPGEIIVQELIPGGGQQQLAYCAFFRDGKAMGKMVARRRRQHPLQFGKASTYVETVDIPPLEDYSERFLRAIDYYGLVELEYKLDPRDQQYKLLDVNARTWGYHSLGPRPASISVICFTPISSAFRLLPVARYPALRGFAWRQMFRQHSRQYSPETPAFATICNRSLIATLKRYSIWKIFCLACSRSS